MVQGEAMTPANGAEMLPRAPAVRPGVNFALLK